MHASEVSRAVAAALATAAALGLTVHDAVVLSNSNRLTLRLRPDDVLVRVAPVARQVAALEVDLAQRLAELGSPVAALDPRVAPQVYERDGFVVTLWTYYEPVRVDRGSRRPSTPVRSRGCMPAYGSSRSRRRTSRTGSTRPDSWWPDATARRRSPRPIAELLADTLDRLRRVVGDRGGEQLLHGEPHPGNVLPATSGPLFIDLETACRGPVEFDLAHAPEEVAEHYPGVDKDLLRECRILMLAMVTTWRWDRDDQLPDGRRLATEWLSRLRAALAA